MKAVVCKALGEPSDLIIESIELPPVSPQEVKVALHASAINFPDILMIQGKYQFKPPLPFTPGFESSGEVIEVGSEVTEFQIGDRVMTKQRYGGFAEEIILPPTSVLPLPDHISFAEGATFPVAYNTAYVALVCRGHLKQGEVLLVHGAAGGVGLAAVEVGKLLGATVIGTVGNASKFDIVKQKGADHVIDYSNGFREQVLELTESRGAEVIYDPVGGDVFDESTRCIAWGGRLLLIGFAGGRIAQVNTNIPLIKGFSIVGVRAGEFGRRNPEAEQENFEVLLNWLKEGKIKTNISHSFPLEQVAEAMQVVTNRQVQGKVVLTIREEQLK